MPVPQTLDDLNTSAALNSPAGSEPVGGNLDDYLRAHASMIAVLAARTGTGASTGTFCLSSVNNIPAWSEN